MPATDYAEPDTQTCEIEKPARGSKPAAEVKIPEALLAKFVGPVTDLYKIDQIKVSYTKYRVNVWTKRNEKNVVVPRFDIANSYYVDYSNATKVIKDETDRRVIALDGGFDASETNCCSR